MTEELRFRTHSISYSYHGLIPGRRAAEFLTGFVPTPPAIPGFGAHVNSGIALYYGIAPPTISAILTLDASQAIPDGLFVRAFMVVDGTTGTIPELQAFAKERVQTALASVGLQIP